MKWPFISRRAYDLLVEQRNLALQECDRLRQMHVKLTDHITRIDRIEHGVSEQPRPPKKELEEMPDKLKRYIDGYGNSSQRGELRRLAKKRYREGTPWDTIRREVMGAQEQDRVAP